MTNTQLPSRYLLLGRIHRRTILRVLVFVLISAICGYTAEQNKPADSRWISLFNGQNLDGWKVKITGYELNDNYGNTFRVKDGILKVCYDQYDKFGGKFGHLFYREKFSHYRLRLEYRFVGDQTPGGLG